MAGMGRKTDENAMYKTGSVLNVWVKQEIKDKIVALADSKGWSISTVVRDIIESYFSK